MRALIPISLLIVIAGCSSAPEAETKPSDAAEAGKPSGPPPAEYRVKLDTTEGPMVMAVHRDWAPLGADRFYELVTTRFYDGSRFHRVVYPFIAQWGINPKPKINAIWNIATIQDDPMPKAKGLHNRLGTLAFAKLGPASRTTEVFINLKDNPNLDKERFVPFGEIVEGMDAAKRLYSFYGEPAPKGKGPDPARMAREGEEYLAGSFSRLDKIEKASIVP